MTGKDFLKLLLCVYGYDRNLSVIARPTGYGEPCYEIHGENAEGDVYESVDSEGLMFNIYEICAYMSGAEPGREWINPPHTPDFKSEYWLMAPKYVLDDEHRNKMISSWDERDRLEKEESERMRPFYEWLDVHHPCKHCTEKVPINDSVNYNCDLYYRGWCPKYRHFMDIEYEEEMKKYRKDE